MHSHMNVKHEKCRLLVRDESQSKKKPRKNFCIRLLHILYMELEIYSETKYICVKPSNTTNLLKPGYRKSLYKRICIKSSCNQVLINQQCLTVLHKYILSITTEWKALRLFRNADKSVPARNVIISKSPVHIDLKDFDNRKCFCLYILQLLSFLLLFASSLC